MDKLVGVIGCGGVIGSEAVKTLLDNGYNVRGGQRRNTSDFDKYHNFSLFQVDIYDKSQLDKFCDGCTVILNCAGPSYKIKDKIALSACQARTIYVDLSDILITQSSLRNNLPSDGRYVVGTGYVPGISGMLLKIICSEFDNISKVKGFQAGRQYYSKMAFYDILLSSMSEAGYPDAYIKNGNIEQEKISTYEKIYIPGLAENVYVKPYLPRELLDIFKKSHMISELHWYNCLTDKRMMNMIMQSYLEISSSYDEEGYKKSAKLYDNLFLHAEKQENWSSIIYDVSGTINESKARKRYILKLKDSNKICGKIGAETVMNVLENGIDIGIHWAKDIVSYESIDKLKKIIKDENILVLSVPYDSPDILVQETESDYI